LVNVRYNKKGQKMIADFYPWSNSDEPRLKESYILANNEGLVVHIAHISISIEEAWQLKAAIDSALNLLLCKQNTQNQE
jgi:hypothetical protein